MILKSASSPSSWRHPTTALELSPCAVAQHQRFLLAYHGAESGLYRRRNSYAPGVGSCRGLNLCGDVRRAELVDRSLKERGRDGREHRKCEPVRHRLWLGPDFYKQPGFKKIREDDLGCTVRSGSATHFLFQTHQSYLRPETRGFAVTQNAPELDYLKLLMRDERPARADSRRGGRLLAGLRWTWVGRRVVMLKAPDGTNLCVLGALT